MTSFFLQFFHIENSVNFSRYQQNQLNLHQKYIFKIINFLFSNDKQLRKTTVNMTSSKTLVKHLCLYWFPKAILLFFSCCYMAHYKCNSSPALWRSFSIPKIPPQWRESFCFLKSSYLACMVSPKTKFKQQNFMHGKANHGRLLVARLHLAPSHAVS